MSWGHTLCAVAEKCDSFNTHPDSSKPVCVPLLCGDQNVGIIRPDILEKLAQFSDVFSADKNSMGRYTALHFADRLSSPSDITEALEAVFLQLRRDDVFPCLKGWRNERYAVGRKFQQELFRCERAAARLLGVLQYGVHMNGYVITGPGELKMWIGRRSATKPTYPGMLDNMVAGGIPAGTGVLDTLIKECEEEASIPRELAEKARPAGTISYVHEASDGIEAETEFIYDLELPTDFKPSPLDGEVSEYHLWDMEKVKCEMAAEHFKPNCALVILKFMIRKGLINPESEPLYERLSSVAHVDLLLQYLKV